MNKHEQVVQAVHHTVETTGFFGAIMAGFLLGFLGDKWLGTDPWLVVIGIISGFAVGFWKMWQISASMEES